jgi:trans-aconitate 2-methyltransferase
LKTSAPTSVVWNPRDYAANSAAQLAWARELIARLKLTGNERILDVGCGDGKITAEIAHALPHGEIVGTDSSPEMIRFARATFPKATHPNLSFQVMDARELHPKGLFDVVFSNAALHWVEDHPAFLQGAATCLKPGGRLIVSCGGKGNAQDVFVALRSVLRRKHWRGHFRNLKAPYFFHSPGDYEKWLPRFGFASRLVRLAEKPAKFDGRSGLASWVRTTWLPYTQRVPEAEREAFVAEVVEAFVARHPLDAAGKLTVRMVRLEIDAERMDLAVEARSSRRALLSFEGATRS